MSILVPNASYPVFPTGTVIRQPGSEINAEPTGLATLTESFRGYFNDMVGLGSLKIYKTTLAFNRTYKQPHFLFPTLAVYLPRIKQVKGVLDGLLTIEYRGLDPALSYPPPPVYTIEETTGNEPLQTHPLWATQIAGTPAVPLNGAQFVSYDKTGANYNPAPAGGNPGTFDPASAVFFQWIGASIFAGTEDYLAAGCIYKKTYTSYSSPSDISSVGSFDDPDGPVPGLPDNYQWFFLGETSQDNAGLFRNEASWKAVPSGDAANIIYGGG